MAPAMKIVFGLLAFVTAGMIVGAFFQLAFILKLEDSYGTEFPSFKRVRKLQSDAYLQLPRGISHWDNDTDAAVLRIGYVKPEIISWSPRIIVLHDFLSSEECDYLRALAKPRLQISTVVDVKTGKGIESKVRTSSGMFLSSEEKTHQVVQAIEKRISVYSQVPIENGELIQVLRYEKNQYYKPHHDYFSDTAGSSKCSCGGKVVDGLCVKPIKGNAVLFWSMGLDGQSDPSSIHGGCEVLSGVKWSATKWMRQRATF
ncbi:prolyl 4-hydroxylase 1 isoform X3 [Populus alba]|uniref:prolyl 4-hydroxylase 1 isoform X3 n=1 Tax=Populus alba TaxID=43335 RepID=UPI003CC7857E